MARKAAATAAQDRAAKRDTALPLSVEEFAALIGPLGPFEACPLVAVAVSGGADSLALCLLAAEWARRHGATIVALTVDHGLRPASADEARRVGAWLAGRGIVHHILTWQPPAGLRNLQERARQARYALLLSWCASASCLHLLTAHHREDQAETFLIRLARGSGLDGLAAMPILRETAECRLLRPLLDVPRTRLTATLEAAGQTWITDPSNDSNRFARVRLRHSAAILEREGLGAARLAATARHLGRARAALESEVTRWLAVAAALHPAGFARLDPTRLAAAPPEIALRALARLAAAIGGADHMARLDRLERLLGALAGGRTGGRTLGGCRFVPHRGGVLVCREPHAAAPPMSLSPGDTVRWDGRFTARLAADAPTGLSIGALGLSGLRQHAERLPGAVRPTLPAIRDLAGIVAVPHLHYERPDRRGLSAFLDRWSFRPENALSGAGFTVV